MMCFCQMWKAKAKNGKWSLYRQPDGSEVYDPALKWFYKAENV